MDGRQVALEYRSVFAASCPSARASARQAARAEARSAHEADMGSSPPGKVLDFLQLTETGAIIPTSMTETIFRDDPYAKENTARIAGIDERGIRLDRTVFYPRGGGQAGDAGRIELGDGTAVEIADTVKGEGS